MLSETDAKLLEKLKQEITEPLQDDKKTKVKQIDDDSLYYVGVKIPMVYVKQLRKRTKNMSKYIRELLIEHLSKTSSENTIKSSEHSKLFKFCFNHSGDKPVQLIGNSGIGKTTAMKNLIANDPSHVYIVLDAHNEYELPEIQTMTDDLTQSCRIKMPEQIAACKGLFQVYYNQILSKRWPNNYVIVIEEAHRYREIKELLKEARKFVKLIAITQEPLGDFTPIVRIR